MGKNCTGVAPDNPNTETRTLHHHADILCCEFPVTCVTPTYVVKYQLPFITIIVRFQRHVSVIVSVPCQRRLCLVTLRLALFFKSRFVVDYTVCVWCGSVLSICSQYLPYNNKIHKDPLCSAPQTHAVSVIKPVGYCSEIHTQHTLCQGRTLLLLFSMCSWVVQSVTTRL
jgi:hypothetical protein